MQVRIQISQIVNIKHDVKKKDGHIITFTHNEGSYYEFLSRHIGSC